MTEVIGNGDIEAKNKYGSKFRILLRLMQLLAIAHGAMQFTQFDDPIDGLKYGALPAAIFVILSGFTWSFADKMRIATEPQRYYIRTTTFGTERIGAYLQQNLFAPIGILSTPVIMLAIVILFVTHYLYDRDVGVFILRVEVQKHSYAGIHAASDSPADDLKFKAALKDEGATQSDIIPKASFNCTTASSEAEKLICSDSSLRSLDAEMGAHYGVIVKETPDIQALRRSQRAWVSNVRDACSTIECMNDAYQSRIRELSDESEAST